MTGTTPTEIGLYTNLEMLIDGPSTSISVEHPFHIVAMVPTIATNSPTTINT